MNRELLRTLYRLTHTGDRYTLHAQEVWVVGVEPGGEAVEIVSTVLLTDLGEKDAQGALAAWREREAD